MTAEAKPDAWMPLLIDRYLGDTGLLSCEEHGAYLLLLMSMWKAGGVLPDDDKKLAQAARLTPAKWRGMRETIRAFFRPDGRGQLVQKRLTIELQRARQRVDAGTKGAKRRWRNDSESYGETGSETHGEPGSEQHGEGHGETVANPVANGMAEIPPFPQSPFPLTPTPMAPDSSSLRSEESLAARADTQGQPSKPEQPPTAGQACKAMREVGLSDANPSDPRLRNALSQRMSVEELVDAARDAVERGKGFGYALQTAIGRRADALAVHVPARAVGGVADMARKVMSDAAAAMAAMDAPGNTS